MAIKLLTVDELMAMERVDGFGADEDGRFHGHVHDCLRVVRDGAVVHKVVLKERDAPRAAAGVAGPHVVGLRREVFFYQYMNGAPGVAPLLGYTETEYAAWLTLPYYATRLTGPHPRLLEIVRGLYDRHVVHGDLSPLNFFMAETGPILIDFQVARLQAQQVPFEASLDVVGDVALATCCGPIRSVNLTVLLDRL